MIPRKIHFIWIGPPVPDWVEFIVDLWRGLNPEFEIIVHRKEDVPDKYKKFYKRMPRIQNKVDLIKWVILQEEGGWIMDTDTIPIRPFNAIYDEVKDSDFVGVEFCRSSSNVDVGFIGATRDARLWKPIDEYLSIKVPVTFNRRNASGYACFNYARAQMPEALKILPKEYYCPFCRQDRVMTDYSKQLLVALMTGDDITEYIAKYVEQYKIVPYGWHIWMTGKATL